MIGLLLKIAGNSGAFYLATLYIGGFTFTGDIAMLAWSGFWITVGSFVKSILGVITFPLSIISLGTFSFVLDFVVSAGVLWVLSFVIEPFAIESLTALLWGAIFIGISSKIISFFVKLIW